MISKAVAGTSVESTIKYYSRRKDGRSEFLANISNHAGDTKYLAIVKSSSKLIHNINWNGRNYPLDQNVSNHRTIIDNFHDCTTHICNSVPNNPQWVEFIPDSIISQDNYLKATMGNTAPTLNTSEVILKELQTNWLKLTRTGDLKNITQQNQTQLKFQRSRLTDGV